jgi:nucleotide-binding universal stress UspA family protein
MPEGEPRREELRLGGDGGHAAVIGSGHQRFVDADELPAEIAARKRGAPGAGSICLVHHLRIIDGAIDGQVRDPPQNAAPGYGWALDRPAVGSAHRGIARMDPSTALLERAIAERRRLSRRGEAEVEVLEGDPGEALAELGGEVDLLVIGSRGMGPWGRLVTGSTSDHLARHATCPVLILPRAVRPAAAHAPDGPSPDPREPVAAAPAPSLPRR